MWANLTSNRAKLRELRFNSCPHGMVGDAGPMGGHWNHPATYR